MHLTGIVRLNVKFKSYKYKVTLTDLPSSRTSHSSPQAPIFDRITWPIAFKMPFVKEHVFTNSTPSQAQEYHAARGTAYPPGLYQHILSVHQRHGGQTNAVVDLGCGPGNATRDLLAYFDHVVGLDGSKAMVETATSLIPEGEAKTRLRFENLPAEQVDRIPGYEANSIDMITAATAAHWFDMPHFYRAALRALKPGGTVAFWIRGLPSVRAEQPHAEEVMEILKQLYIALAPYRQESATSAGREKSGEMNTGNEYLHLPLPWTCDPPVDGFDQASFQRVSFCDENDNQLLPGYQMTISHAEKAFGTGSPVMRWRELHPGLVGTDQDIVRSHFNRVRRLLGVEDAELATNMRFTVLTWKKA